jgi:hypothetical protein
MELQADAAPGMRQFRCQVVEHGITTVVATTNVVLPIYSTAFLKDMNGAMIDGDCLSNRLLIALFFFPRARSPVLPIAVDHC